MAVLPQLESILANDALDDETVEDTKCEQVEALIPIVGWDTVLSSVTDVLSAERRPVDYQVAAEVLWGVALDGREMPANRVIALLYHRFDPNGDEEDNLVWSITSKLKGVGYLSEYDPLTDPAVARELDAFRAG